MAQKPIETKQYFMFQITALTPVCEHTYTLAHTNVKKWNNKYDIYVIFHGEQSARTEHTVMETHV